MAAGRGAHLLFQDTALHRRLRERYRKERRRLDKRHGLEVDLRPGRPQVNHDQLLAAGVLDFNLASNSVVPLNLAQEKIPMLAIAAIFQKDPSVLIAHSAQGDDSLAALKGKP